MARRLALALVATALAAPAAAEAARTTYYVSVGDSYAQGYQAIGPDGRPVPTNKGYTDYLYKRLKRNEPGLKLIKLGCGGATTDSMINGTRRCNPAEELPYESETRSTSQLTYASNWIANRRKRVKYVTVSIGGNDFASCAGAGDFNQIITCTAEGIEEMKRNLPTIAKSLRRAGGSKAVIVGSTYPDVILGEWVRGDEDGRNLARASIDVFREQINPPMKRLYGNQRIGFVDATRAFGAYIPLERTTTLGDYGEIPVAVANICTLGWYCFNRDIHLKSSGYAKQAALFHAQIRKIRRQQRR